MLSFKEERTDIINLKTLYTIVIFLLAFNVVIWVSNNINPLTGEKISYEQR